MPVTGVNDSSWVAEYANQPRLPETRITILSTEVPIAPFQELYSFDVGTSRLAYLGLGIGIGVLIITPIGPCQSRGPSLLYLSLCSPLSLVRFTRRRVWVVSCCFGPRSQPARSLAFLILAAVPLYDDPGLVWSNSVLDFITLAFTPVPCLLCRYGETWGRALRLTCSRGFARTCIRILGSFLVP